MRNYVHSVRMEDDSRSLLSRMVSGSGVFSQVRSGNFCMPPLSPSCLATRLGPPPHLYCREAHTPHCVCLLLWWISQEDLEAACHWVKQINGLACGVTFGLMPLTGYTAIITFVLSTLLLTWFTYAQLLRADLELLGVERQGELIKEGAPAAVAVFFLSWTVTYTLFSSA